ncbi:hypothetical protein GCM10009632_19240 [Mycolicibacterium alvei]
MKRILDKQMDRQDFIKHMAVGAVALVGGGVLIRMGLLGNGSDRTSRQAGYGDSAYGGSKQGGEQPARRAA